MANPKKLRRHRVQREPQPIKVENLPPAVPGLNDRLKATREGERDRRVAEFVRDLWQMVDKWLREVEKDSGWCLTRADVLSELTEEMIRGAYTALKHVAEPGGAPPTKRLRYRMAIEELHAAQPAWKWGAVIHKVAQLLHADPKYVGKCGELEPSLRWDKVEKPRGKN